MTIRGALSQQTDKGTLRSARGTALPGHKIHTACPGRAAVRSVEGTSGTARTASCSPKERTGGACASGGVLEGQSVWSRANAQSPWRAEPQLWPGPPPPISVNANPVGAITPGQCRDQPSLHLGTHAKGEDPQAASLYHQSQDLSVHPDLGAWHRCPPYLLSDLSFRAWDPGGLHTPAYVTTLQALPLSPEGTSLLPACRVCVDR